MSQKRTTNNQASKTQRLTRKAVSGALGLIVSGTGLFAQQFPDRPLYLPRSRGETTKQALPPVYEEGLKPSSTEPATAIAATQPDPSLFTTAPRLRPHEVSVSGDFMLGSGEVTVPIGFSLHDSLPPAAQRSLQVGVAAAERESLYYGGTVSYSYGRNWYVDFGYAQGESSGTRDFRGFENPNSDFKTDFKIEDQWYQGYVRYTFPGLLPAGFAAYLRAGATYVQADMTVNGLPAGVLSTGGGTGTQDYHQDNSTTDILGNLGFGVGYLVYGTEHVRVALIGEGEGFYGFRSQESRETLGKSAFTFKTTTIDNTLYGGIGRVTARFEYRFGNTGALKVFVDGGAQVRYTLIDYPDAKDVPNEMLWGPYVKLGVRYSF